MAEPLKTTKIEEMFAVWCETPSIEYVTRVCRVSQATVQKYKKLGNWIERKAKVIAKVERKTETEAEKRLERHIKLSQTLQAKGFEALRGNEKKGVAGVKIKTAFDARMFIVDGVKLEREVLGDAVDMPTEIKIQVVYIEGKRR